MGIVHNFASRVLLGVRWFGQSTLVEGNLVNRFFSHRRHALLDHAPGPFVGAFIAQRFSRKLRVARWPPSCPRRILFVLIRYPVRSAEQGPSTGALMPGPGLDGGGAEGGLAVLSAPPL